MEADWEAILAAEGLAPLPDRVPDIANGIVSDTDRVELRAHDDMSWAHTSERVWSDLVPLVYWLPTRDQALYHMHTQGMTQREMGKILQIGQTSVCMAVEKMRTRIRALAEHPLPRDRDHLLELAAGLGYSGIQLDWITVQCDLWSAEATRKRIGMTQYAGRKLHCKLREHSGPVGHWAMVTYSHNVGRLITSRRYAPC